MADHVDANTSKGAGKSPRVPRTSRRASTYNNSSTTESNSAAPSTSSSSLRSVPKRKSQPNDEASTSKKIKVLEGKQGRERKSARSLSTKSSRSQSSKSTSPQRDQSRRNLRKRKSFPITVSLGKVSYSSDSDNFEVVTTEEEDEVESVVVEESVRKRGRPKKIIPSVPKPSTSTKSGNSSVNTKKKEDIPASSSKTRNPSGGSGANKSHRKQPSTSATTTSESEATGTSAAVGKTRGRKSQSFSSNRSEAAATSDQTATQSISSRLRLTPSRAAAASQRAALERENASAYFEPNFNNSLENTPRPLGSGGPRSRTKVNNRKENRQGGRAEESGVADSEETSRLEVEDSVDSSTVSAAGRSSASSSGGCIFRYQLRSRTSVDTVSGGSSGGRSSLSTTSKANQKNNSSGGNFSGLKSILSEKERVLRRKSGGGGGAGEDGGTSKASGTNHKAAADRGSSSSGGRGGGGGATATSNTTGSCASSRCGRGGGPSSSSEGAGGGKSGGSEGMNNLPGSSSTTNDQPNLLGVASGTTDGLTSAGAAGTSSTAGGASTSSGVGSVPRAMNSGSGSGTAATTTGAGQSQEDTDDGEMGRLQALLESRGLPPHLFGSLAPRMQQLLHRGMSNSTVTKAQNLLQGLQATGDEGQQLQAAIEMCQLLVMGNEDTLAGFPVKQTVPALIQLLSMEHNFDIMNHACRALTYMMEALPRSTPVVAEAIPVFLEKLQSIQCMDVAEQSLTALEMLSRRHAKAILQARGVSACLTFLDFFSIVAQRAALSVTANCCQNLHGEEFHLVKDSLKFLSERLTQQDKKSVESVCLAFSRLVDSFNTDPKRLEEMASPELLANLQQLLVVTPPVVSTGTFILVLRMLAQMCARSPNIAVKLLEHNIVGTLLSLLLGSASATADSISDDVELVARNHQELLEIVALIAELLPKLPKDGIFIVNTMMTNPQVTTQDAVQWQWRDDRGNWNSYSSFDSRIIEAAHQSGEDEISLSMQSRTYTVDFLGMQQINEDTGTARSVQRKVNAFYTLKSGAPDGQEKPAVPEDERSGFLSVHPDFPLPFLRPLFALLSEANSSSAGPAVRQSCLKTLLRIVHFLPAESLQKVLKPQLVSNNLASMLGSSDLKIVVGSFQLCCLLMEKLQEDFLVHFRREGVFHQISRISSSEVVGPSPMKSDQMGIGGLLSGHAPSSSSAAAHILSTPVPGGPTASSSAIPSTIAVVPLSVNNLNNVSISNTVSSGIGGIGVVGGVGGVVGTSMPILPSTTSSPPIPPSPHPSVTMNVVNVPIIPPTLNHHSNHLSMQIHHHHHHNNHPPPPPPPNSSHHHTHSHSSSGGVVPSSPYSICLGGFFVQQSPMANPALPPTNDLNTATSATPHHILLLPPPPHPADREIINVQPSSLVSLGGSASSSANNTPLSSITATSQLSTPNIKPGAGAYEIPLPPYNNPASLLGEGSSAIAVIPGGATSSPNNPGASGRTNPPPNPSDKKLADHETTQALYDAFKRKRVSKRAIPTGTSRRTRPEDVACPSGSGNAVGSVLLPPTASAGGGPVQSAKRTSSKSGFFANLHPSRWTRGSSGSGSNSVGNNNPSSSSNNNNNTTPSGGASGTQQHHTGGGSLSHHYTHLHGHHGNPLVVGGMSITSGSNPSSSSRNNSFNVSYKEQVKAWLKEQSTAFTSKYCINKTAGGDGNATGGGTGKNGTSGATGVNLPGCSDGVEILPKLGEIINCLRQESKMTETLKELRTIVMESDISSFEVNHSGLIGALLAFLTDDNGYRTPRESRLRAFIHVFADCPIDRLCGDELDSHSGARSGSGSALSCLVAKLNSCLSQLEQFQVKVHEVPTSSTGTRAAPTSALRFFNTHQIKCNLQRHPGCTSLRQWKGGPVKIDSLALVQTIERYLIAKGFSRVRESRDSGDSEDDNSDDDIDDTLAAAVISQGNARHKLQFLIGEQVLPYNMTVYQAIRQFGPGGSDPNAELEAEFDPASALLGSSGLWAQTHTIYYRPVPDEGVGGSTTASGGTSLVSTSSSKKKSKSLTSSSKNSSKSKKDPLWHEGILPEPTPPYLAYLSCKLPDSVSVSDPCLPVLTLLRVIHSVCRYWRYLYWPVINDKPLLPPCEFINTKVAAKAQRQLQDPVVIMTGNVPQWLQQIGAACPFLFPFETRQMLFYSVTFDRDRALQRLLDSVPELNSTEREDRVTPRLDRRKRTISRDNILSHAEQLMNDFGSSRPLLEIQYDNEVGTGLGPTLEFYALVSQELQKKELDLWHSESSIGENISSEDSLGDANSKKGGKGYVISGVGLFPKPLGKSVKAGHVSKVKTKFKFMGKFMAKAVMDSRMIDLPLSKTLYKWVLDGEGSSMCLADILEVDSTVARSIRQLVGVVSQKKKLEHRCAASGSDLNAALESLTLDGCRIDNLGLDFTLPGHPSIDLKKGGKDIPVTIHNLEDYVKLVCHWMLVSGVGRQMEAWKEGFDSVFNSASLRMFYPEELEMVFCGSNQTTNENWDVKTLMECCRADHGFTLESRAIQSLFQIMASYNGQERRKFVQFVTGSPRLPVGGFKSLQPPLTIVRKTVDGLPSETDSYLPSVMTCVNYLKLPDYSSAEVMRDRLKVAVEEGQLSFHLS